MTSYFCKSVALIAVIFAAQALALAVPTLGKLRTRNNKPITVNGSSVASGTTILSKSRIKVPEKVGATVDLGRLGRLDIGPKTELVLDFDDSEISVQLDAGYVVLSTKQGIKGTVNTSEGVVYSTDPSKDSSVIARTKGSLGPETGAEIGALDGLGNATAVGAGAAGMAVMDGSAAAKTNGRGRNLSTDNPRAPQN